MNLSGDQLQSLRELSAELFELATKHPDLIEIADGLDLLLLEIEMPPSPAPEPKLTPAQEGGRISTSRAEKRARALAPVVNALLAEDYTLQEITDELNRRHILTARGNPWCKRTFCRLLNHQRSLGLTVERVY